MIKCLLLGIFQKIGKIPEKYFIGPRGSFRHPSQSPRGVRGVLTCWIQSHFLGIAPAPVSSQSPCPLTCHLTAPYSLADRHSPLPWYLAPAKSIIRCTGFYGHLVAFPLSCLILLIELIPENSVGPCFSWAFGSMHRFWREFVLFGLWGTWLWCRLVNDISDNHSHMFTKTLLDNQFFSAIRPDMNHYW